VFGIGEQAPCQIEDRAGLVASFEGMRSMATAQEKGLSRVCVSAHVLPDPKNMREAKVGRRNFCARRGSRTEYLATGPGREISPAGSTHERQA
jgi:hypothetical protein